MEDFNNLANNNNLIHLPTKWAFFTLSNGRKGNQLIEKRLDRCIFNQDLISTCSTVSCFTLARIKSGHFLLVLEFKLNDIGHATSLKFMQMWALNPDCKDNINRIRNTSTHGSPVFVLNHKLKLVKEELKIWNKQTFGNVHSIVKDATLKINNIQLEIDKHGSSDILLEEESTAKIDLEKALLIEDSFWREKVRFK